MFPPHKVQLMVKRLMWNITWTKQGPVDIILFERFMLVHQIVISWWMMLHYIQPASNIHTLRLHSLSVDIIVIMVNSNIHSLQQGHDSTEFLQPRPNTGDAER